MSIHLRPATSEDAQSVLAIYAPYVRDTAITFEYQVPDIDSFTERMQGIMRAYPYVAAERNGRLCGYAYASRHMERAAYAWDVQTSVYVAPDCKGKGVGRTLYQGLFAVLRAQGYCNAYAIVTLPNEPSVAFHAASGFAPCGVHHRTGYKFGTWHDVAWMEKHLAAPVEPAPPRTPLQLGGGRVLELLAAVS